MSARHFLFRFQGQDRDIEFRDGETVLDALRRHPSLAPSAPCSGFGRCGRCRVVALGFLPIHPDEEKFLDTQDLTMGIRLACRLPADDGLRVSLENTSVAFIPTYVEDQAVDLDPVLRRRVVVLPPGSLEDQRASSSRLEDALEIRRGTLPLPIIQALSAIPDGSPLTATLLGDVVLAVDSGDWANRPLWAAAVDIGTTTVAMYLVDLATGGVTDAQADLNRQASFGADVISRLQYARKGLLEAMDLQRAVVAQLGDMLRRLCSLNDVAHDDIHVMAVAGNTAMIHFLCGLDAGGLGEAPFLPTALEFPDFTASTLGLDDFPDLLIRILPSLSAFVGADITAGILASGMHHRQEVDLLLDIGTNGEMALGDKDGVTCCSTAAGPAFEGAHLSCGLGSVPGAVDHVDYSDGSLSFSTIGNEAALGFCGSGVVDLVAFLVRGGLIDETGRLADADSDVARSIPGISIVPGVAGAEVVWSESITGGRVLKFTQKDLREVQLAKAAIAAGITTLLSQAGLQASDVQTLWLAGGFGSYIRPESAAAIGLIPEVLISRTRSLGNASARGALLCLLSRDQEAQITAIARESISMELSGRPDFQDAYIEGMMFPR